MVNQMKYSYLVSSMLYTKALADKLSLVDCDCELWAHEMSKDKTDFLVKSEKVITTLEMRALTTAQSRRVKELKDNLAAKSDGVWNRRNFTPNKPNAKAKSGPKNNSNQNQNQPNAN